MSYKEISKIHKNLGKLVEDSYELRRKIAREFSTQKGIPIRDLASRNVDVNTTIKFNRYISNGLGEEQTKNIPKDTKIERFSIGQIPAEWISIPGAIKEKVFYHLFGGGYTMGTLESRRWIPYHISRTTNLRCLNIEYRLAPEYPFPAALEDSIDSYKWLIAQGFDPKKIIIGGESAGGGLTIATLLKLRESKIPLPVAGVLMSPWVDLTASGESIIRNQKFEPIIQDGLETNVKVYAQNEPPTNPLISPVFADLKGLPPLLIQVGGIEVLLDDSISLAERAKEDGVEVKLEVYENMTHVFQEFGAQLSESRQAFESVNTFIKKFV